MQSATSIQFISDSGKNTFNHGGKSTVLTVNAIQCCSDAELRRARNTPIPKDGQPILSYDAGRNWITTMGFICDMKRLHCKCDRKFPYAA